MSQLTPYGQQIVKDLIFRYYISEEAVLHLLFALVRGNGVIAQFSHPELGGIGQWRQGATTIMKDEWCSTLQTEMRVLVENLCIELSQLMREQQLLQPSAINAQTTWYPAELGVPTSSGGEGDFRYAYFVGNSRLAIEENGEVNVYNSLDNQIIDVLRSQDGGDWLLNTPYGMVKVSKLPFLYTLHQSVSQKNPESHLDEPPLDDYGLPQETALENEIFGFIEQLSDLHNYGMLTDAEFKAKKAMLLKRLEA